MDVHKVATDALSDLMKDGTLETRNLLALSSWVTQNRKKDGPEMDALRTALMSADESENETSEHVEGQITRMTRTISALSVNVPLSSVARAWLKEVIGDLSALLAQCVRSTA